MLFALTAFTCLLAVLQDAIWLAIFGIVGGFAAPILTSTGKGSHIGLFSYYALLNAGVLAIALKRSWHLLNLLGFAFTFVIATVWGVLRYEAQDYASVQGFLILFLLFYVAISLLRAGARRQGSRTTSTVRWSRHAARRLWPAIWHRARQNLRPGVLGAGHGPVLHHAGRSDPGNGAAIR